jgi:hypothetical protein
MTNEQKIRALRAQINAHKAVKFTYQNTKRTGDPYTLGISNGKYAIRLYQTGGKSSSGLKKHGSPEDFRFFYLEDIDSLEELVVHFDIHSAYKENDEAFEKIDTQVKKK